MDRPLRPRLLVIDDDPLVARSIRRGLKSDWDVSVMDDARVAVVALEAGAAFDVVLCDLVMPVMTGMDAYEEIQRRAPGVESRMVFMTGGTTLPASRPFLDRVPNPRLEKPFSMSDLRVVLERVIGAVER